MKQQDRAAAQALNAVDETAETQLRALAALQAVVDVAADDGLVRGLIERFRDERQQAFVRFHELSSKYFHDEADLFREYASAVRKNESADPVRQKFNEHKKQIDEMQAEATKLGIDPSVLLPDTE